MFVRIAQTTNSPISVPHHLVLFVHAMSTVIELVEFAQCAMQAQSHQVLLVLLVLATHSQQDHLIKVAKPAQSTTVIPAFKLLEYAMAV